MLYSLLVVIHILICIVLALVVLMQSSKGGGLAGAFGGAGGAPQQLLGSRGMTTLLHKMTIYLAVAFFISSFLLFMVDTSDGQAGRGSIVGEAAREGDLNVPIQENPFQDIPAQDPVSAPTETPAGQGDEKAPGETETQGGGN